MSSNPAPEDQPSYSHYGGNNGGTFYVDVAPLQRTPHLAWAKTFGVTALIASPLGLVLTSGSSLLILNPATATAIGKRARLSGQFLGSAQAMGDTVLVPHSKGLDSFDLRTAQKLWSVPLPDGVQQYFAPRLWLTSTATVLSAHDVSDPRTRPVPAWRDQLPPGIDYAPGSHAAGDLVMVQERLGQVRAIDRSTGALRWRREGQIHALDERGAVVLSGEEWGLLDLQQGEMRYRQPIARTPRIFAPDFIVVEDPPGGQRSWAPDAKLPFSILGRAPGTPVASPGVLSGTQLIGAAARDVIYIADPRTSVTAYARTGERLWRFDVPKLAWPINNLIPIPEGVVGVTGNGRVFCLVG